MSPFWHLKSANRGDKEEEATPANTVLSKSKPQCLPAARRIWSDNENQGDGDTGEERARAQTEETTVTELPHDGEGASCDGDTASQDSDGASYNGNIAPTTATELPNATPLPSGDEFVDDNEAWL
ncbi:hypothetical protein S245_034937 [Arachis hypogaea]